jgi:hypothetical protein
MTTQEKIDFILTKTLTEQETHSIFLAQKMLNQGRISQTLERAVNVIYDRVNV